MNSFEFGTLAYSRNLLKGTEIARETHEPLARYHNFEAHSLGETLPNVTRLGRICLERGIPVSLPRLQFGALLHDSFVFLPLTGDIYPTKEARSGEFATIVLDSMDAPEDTTEGVSQDITTTARYEPFRSVAGAVLGTADMVNVAGPYTALTLPRTFDVWLEALQQGIDLSLGDLLAGCPAVFTDFALKELPPELRTVPEIQRVRHEVVKSIELIKQETPESAVAKLGLTMEDVDKIVTDLEYPSLQLVDRQVLLSPFINGLGA